MSSCPCFFVSDLHGSIERYQKLFAAIVREKPRAVLLGGDLLPSGLAVLASSSGAVHDDFVNNFLAPGFERVAAELGAEKPRVLIILGNDDLRFEEAAFLDVASRGVWEYIHERRVDLCGHPVYGYSFVPPTPFMFKDWERYDVSRYVDPGCVSPEGGSRSVEVPPARLRYATIKKDLARLTQRDDLSRAVFLFHTPPYDTALDRAALDGKMVEHVPLDVHVGSIAVRRFILARRPLITLHGHVHESAGITGRWRETLGSTEIMSAAHDGSELALVRFDPSRPGDASRELL